MAGEIALEITINADTVVVAFKSASLSDVDRLAKVSDEIKEFVDKNQPKKLVFDFKGVKFFSSQVLGLLLDIRARMSKYNGEIVISAINPQLHRVFKITNLDKVIEFFPDKESALKITSTN